MSVNPILSKRVNRLFKIPGNGLWALLLTAVLYSATGYAQGTWTPVASAAPDYNAGVMLMLTNGNIMVKTSAGSNDDIGSGWDMLVPDIHGSYVNGTWYQTSDMLNSRLYFSSQVLQNGNVYVAGGEYGTGAAAGEVYYPQYDAWVPAPPLTNIYDTLLDANSEILPDGKVLQAVVITDIYIFNYAYEHTYIYDPVANTYTPGPHTLGGNDESAWLKLPDNSILFINIGSTNAERYIPATNTWIPDASVPVGLYDPFGSEEGAAFLLPDGRGFFIGSTSYTAFYTPSGSAAPGVWTAGPAIPDSLGAPDAAAAMMVNGKVLCAFSHTPTLDSVFHPGTTYYEFDYLTDSFTQVGAPGGGDTIEAPAYYSNMLCLPDGTILYCSQGDDQYYVYTPSGTTLAAGKPAIDSIMAMTPNCDSFMATGKLFNGITEGAGYGDDWQMSTNYPIVRLSRNDTVIYATTYNWNSTGVMRGTNEDSTTFVVPQGLQPGIYSLQVVANGNASDSVPFLYCLPPVNTAVKNVAPGNSISVYPNPTDKITTITFACKESGKYNLRLVDTYGRVVKQVNGTATSGENAYTLQVDGIAKGIYTISLHCDGGAYNTRLTIE